MRKLLVLFVVLAFAGSAWSACQITGTNTIGLTMTIQPYCYIEFQNNSYAAGTPDLLFQAGDWWRNTLIGQYGTATDNPADGWACGYFETKDMATVFIKANYGLTCNVVTDHDLQGQTCKHIIPTWFTTHVTGWDDCAGIWNVNGFPMGTDGSGNTMYIKEGPVPPGASVAGGYGGDGAASTGSEASGLNILYGNQDFYPNQDAFPMGDKAGAGYTYTMDMGGTCGPVGPGTMTWHARILRNGVLDVADTYNASITVNFTN